MANVKESILEITQDEFEKIIAEEVGDITDAALTNFRTALEKEGLVLTADLKNSLTRFVISNTVAMVAKAEIEFNAYGRFKDMKKYTYNGAIPPVHKIEEFVRKNGIEKFGWVFYYRHLDKRPSGFASDERTINRIAWAIAMNKRRFPTVKRENASWYNENKMNYLNEVKKRLRWRINTVVHRAFTGAFESVG